MDRLYSSVGCAFCICGQLHRTLSLRSTFCLVFLLDCILGLGRLGQGYCEGKKRNEIPKQTDVYFVLTYITDYLRKKQFKRSELLRKKNSYAVNTSLHKITKLATINYTHGCDVTTLIHRFGPSSLFVLASLHFCSTLCLSFHSPLHPPTSICEFVRDQPLHHAAAIGSFIYLSSPSTLLK